MNIDEIRARAEAATTGPWTHEEYGFGINAKERKLFFAYGCDDQTFTDMDFVCHAREDIPALLDALEAKERELAAAVSDMKIMALAMRESEELSEGCCFACVCDAQNLPDDCILPYGECPGYEKDDCFEWRGRKEQNDG